MKNNKKYLITLVLTAFLAASNSGVNAANSSDLLRMDIKKSATENTVDVTFYTTGRQTSSVVTRKAENRYVVLLPNTESVSSIVPSLGGVKDLISNIDVKNVDDGIGGYTKVTFSTTKPVKIQTHMQKTSPLTKAQQDYKALIAQKHEVKVQNNKPETKSTTQTKQSEKPAVSKSTTPKSIVEKTSTQQVQKQEPQKATNTKKNAKQTEDKLAKNTQQNGKTQAPKIEQKVTTTKVENTKNKVNTEIQADNKINKNNTPKSVSSKKIPDANLVFENENNLNKQINYNNLIIPGLGLLGFVILMGLAKILKSLTRKKQNNDKKLFDNSKLYRVETQSTNVEKNEKIIEDKNLNWQEKYKQYSEEQQKINDTQVPKLSYVTDISGEKGAIVEPQKINTKEEDLIIEDKSVQNTISEQEIQNKKVSFLNLKKIQGNIKQIPRLNVNQTKEQIISKIEHAFTQSSSTLDAPEHKNVFSEDDTISAKFDSIKLKSFSKNLGLRETHRTLANNKKDEKHLTESKFVKLKNSPLTMSRRKFAKSELGELLQINNKYLSNYNGEMNMTGENENYVLSSLDEYLSILDSEEQTKQVAKESLSKIRTKNLMSRSGITNPFAVEKEAENSSNNSTITSMKNVIVKSGYSLDKDKGFYLVNMNGTSAIIGRIKENVFVLKKFNTSINEQLQVRLDYGNVYIVKAGGFKCLVEVSEDKMGTLIEI